MRRLLLAVGIAALLGCGGSRPAGPAAALVAKTAPKLVCPDAVAALERGFQDPEQQDSGSVVVRQCEPGRFGGQPGFFVVASFGPADDSKSEEGWRIDRFVVDARGKLLAKGPLDGAGWMTGVQTGTLQLVDLDADGSDEILEVVAQYFGNPMVPTRTLTAWRLHGGTLEAALLLLTEYHVADDADAPPDCTARYQVVPAPGGHHALQVTARTRLEHPPEPADPDDPDQPAPDPDALPAHVRRDVVHAMGGEAEGGDNCLATGSYRYELRSGAFTIKSAR